MALKTSVTIDFQPIWLFLGIASGAGLIGVIAGRWKDVFNQSGWVAAGELFTSFVAGPIVFELILIGKLADFGMGPMWVSILGAALAGVVGGYMGLAVFKGLQGILGWLQDLAQQRG